MRQDRFIRSLELSKARRDWDWEAARRECVKVACRVAAPDDAEDAAQDALLRAWRMRASCRSGDPAAWVRAIARHEALRALARAPAHAGLDAAGEPGECDAGVESAGRRIDLAAGLRRLDPLDRRLIVLRYALDLTQARVAEVVGMPEGTVKVRLHRARRALAKGMDVR